MQVIVLLDLGILKNPLKFDGSSQFDDSTASGLYAVKLTGVGSSTLTFTDDERIIQTIGIGSTSKSDVLHLMINQLRS